MAKKAKLMVFDHETTITYDSAEVLAPPPRRPIDILIGQRLAQLRGLNGLTIRALAAALDIPPQSIRSYETGSVRAPPDVLSGLVNFFQVPLIDLMAGSCDCDGHCEEIEHGGHRRPVPANLNARSEASYRTGT